MNIIALEVHCAHIHLEVEQHFELSKMEYLSFHLNQTTVINTKLLFQEKHCYNF